MINISQLFKILIPSKNISLRTLKAEQKICVEFANYLRERTLKGDFGYIWFHIPNEFSSYNPIYGLKMGWMGRVPGVADFCFVGKDKSFFIEFKTLKGVLSPSQKIFESWCTAHQVNYFIAHSSEEGIKIVEDALNEKF
ncbi:MAG TPA: hypothetical protein VHA52_09870 [Candidatus Babeliaceae bacterium]|nr:hypothetical protein [Candidatus Babeliaceae bacterium]